MGKMYVRRWRGYSQGEVSDRMRAIGGNQFKSKRAMLAHMRSMVEARGEWRVVDGKRVYFRKSK